MGPWPDLMADRGSALLSLLERDIRDPRGPRGEGLALGLGMSDKLERTLHHGPWAMDHGPWPSLGPGVLGVLGVLAGRAGVLACWACWMGVLARQHVP